MKRVNNKIYFDSDEEFFMFSVKPHLVIKEGEHCKYTSIEFTENYKRELENGTRFCIKDEKSLITKRNAVSLGIETRKVENLEPWFGIEM